MIPKKIHYCWFGNNKKPEIVNKCLQSWKEILPDYEIIEWNENNFDINFNKYTKQAYKEHKYPFVSDVARLQIIYQHGGIYLDTDVEVLKKFDDLLLNKAFFGIETEGLINTGICFGAIKNNEIVKKMLQEYDNIPFSNNGKYDLTPCPIRNSRVLIREGFKLNNRKQQRNGIAIYPSEYFNPKIAYGHNITITKNTYSIHHYAGTWLSDQQKKRSNLVNMLKKKFGDKTGTYVYKTLFAPYILISKQIEKRQTEDNAKDKTSN